MNRIKLGHLYGSQMGKGTHLQDPEEGGGGGRGHCTDHRE